MNAHSDDSCLEPATLAAFIDGTLSPERAASVTRHLSMCAKCRLIVASACEVEQDLENRAAVRPAAARFWWVGAAAIVALLIVGAVILSKQGSPKDTDPIAALVAASPTSARTIESRMSGGFPWAPLRPLRRSDGGQKSPEELVARGAAGAVLRQLGGRRTPQALHAAGIAYMVAGEPRAAVSLLQEAARGAECDASCWNDLSAALYASASPDDRAQLTRALEAADRTIRLDPRMVEAYFNRALILERIGTPQQVNAAWKEYLQRDASGGWAAEARMRLTNVVP